MADEKEKKYTEDDLEKAKKKALQEGADNAKKTYQDKLEDAKKEAVSGVEKETLDSIKTTIGFDYEVDSVDDFKKAWDKYVEAQGDIDDVKDTPEYKNLQNKLQEANTENQKLETKVKDIEDDYQKQLESKDVGTALSRSFSDVQEDIALNADDAIDLFQRKSGFQIKVLENGKTEILDENGMEELGGDGNPKELKNVMRDWLSKRGYSKVDGAAGGETKPGDTSGNTLTRTAFDKLNPTARAKAVQEGVEVVD